jgi:hypothetical protein
MFFQAAVYATPPLLYALASAASPSAAGFSASSAALLSPSSFLGAGEPERERDDERERERDRDCT